MEATSIERLQEPFSAGLCLRRYGVTTDRVDAAMASIDRRETAAPRQVSEIVAG